MTNSAEALTEGSAPTSLIARFASRIHIAPEGAPIVLPVVALGLGLAVIGFGAIAAILIIVGIALAMFFRDPQRHTIAGADAVVSGADGRICDIAVASIPGSGDAALYTRISVFMSPLDVHINRASVSGDVTALAHAKGEFRAAFRDDASDHNERNLIMIRDDNGHDHALIQVAGYLARRIVCYLRLHQRLERGQRIGLIMFGSRVDHFLPQQYRVAVQVGDRVRAGETIIGEPPA
ncbi:MAG: phosphatidylserine decarboxylase [Deltaproteobacteria bacterium]|nr:phosphatidylserine decarboxylase [Deltaproteobacteria bacterium]